MTDLTKLVKPLVWIDFEARGSKAAAFYQANYKIDFWNHRQEWEVSFSYPGYGTGYDGPRWHSTIEAAKAAAEADYAARIAAAIDPAALDAMVREAERRTAQIAASLFPGGYDNNLSKIQSTLIDKEASHERT